MDNSLCSFPGTCVGPIIAAVIVPIIIIIAAILAVVVVFIKYKSKAYNIILSQIIITYHIVSNLQAIQFGNVSLEFQENAYVCICREFSVLTRSVSMDVCQTFALHARLVLVLRTVQNGSLATLTSNFEW